VLYAMRHPEIGDEFRGFLDSLNIESKRIGPDAE